jgi:hypothetical protein
VVELRGFEPLTFSNGWTVEIARTSSTDLEQTRSIVNPATDRVA